MGCYLVHAQQRNSLYRLPTVWQTVSVGGLGRQSGQAQAKAEIDGPRKQRKSLAQIDDASGFNMTGLQRWQKTPKSEYAYGTIHVTIQTHAGHR